MANPIRLFRSPVKRRDKRSLWPDLRATISSPVTRSITLWVLASIVVIELAILVPSLLDRRDELVAEIDARNRYAAEFTLREDGFESADRLVALSDVVAVALHSPEGRLLDAAGALPEMIPEPVPSSRPHLDGNRIISHWHLMTDTGPVQAIVWLRADDVGHQLLYFGLRILGLVLVIALFVTAVTMAIVGSRVLRPLVSITRAVREARRTGRREYVDPRQPGEFGELVAQYNATINEQQAAEERGERLYYQAMHDPLTGLPNRSLFSDRLNQALERSTRYGEGAAIFLMDLDRFKLFNDTHGHLAGDELLCAVAERMRDTLRNSDTVARIGGDEFAIIEPRITPETDCEELGERLRKAIKRPFTINGTNVTLATSVGVTLLPEDGTDDDTLIVNADIAMYRAKHDGGDRVCRFRPEMRDHVVRRLTLEHALKEGLTGSQFELHYQPIVDLSDDTVTSFEALVRWHHPEWGLIPPNHFLPVVEQTGMIVELGDWILARAVADLPHLQKIAPGCTRVAVNVAAGQLAEVLADEMVQRALVDTNLNGNNLTLEITESEVLGSTESTIAGLQRAGDMGVTIAIDDFGTGYSSLAQVQDLPGHILKIDRRFVASLSGSQRACDLFASVVSMGHSLGMQVVAEGIETTEQLEIVRASGCDRGQGYLLGRPLPLSTLLKQV